MGSVHPADPHRGRRHRRLRGPGRRPVDVGDARRVDRHRQARGHRLAHGSARGQQDLRPAMVIKGKDGKVLKLARGGDARYLLAVDAILSVDPGGKVKAGDVIARIPTESAKTRDITGGLPRVAELFEARRPKEAAVIAEISGTVRFGRDYKNKRRHHASSRPSKDEEPRGVSRSQGQAHPSAGRRRHREGRLTSSTAIRRRTTSWRSRASRSLPTTSSTRSRRSTGCRAWRSTTSTSR